ncbi:Crp/Fnr family transcriptional regulator [Streptomyces sp. B21-083]|uniref:Crp/Fnr family transcriptional regulator n=1 Tax=Streptomyces sp. B21-083 TaxID=3039410 RepID=UPI002FF37561
MDIVVVDEGSQGRLLTADERAQWRELGQVRRFGDGEVLLREGENARRVMLLVGGRVKVVTSTDEGAEVVLAYREPGEVLGEMAALDGGEHSASVIAVGPVETWALSPERFEIFLDRSPRACRAMLMVMVHRLRQADRQRLEYRARSVTERIAGRLLFLSDQVGEPMTDGGVRIGIRLTLPELAATVAAGRDMTVKAMSRLRALEVVTTDAAHHFVLPDLEALRAVAEGRAARH